jgi:hypothetical protein
MNDNSRGLGGRECRLLSIADLKTQLKKRLLKFAVCAVCLCMTAAGGWTAFCWLRTERQWMEDRQAAVDWAESSAACNLWRASTESRLPIGLRALGEQNCIEYFWIDPDKLPADQAYRISELRGLFPEARVIAMSHSLPAPLVAEDGIFRMSRRKKITYGLVQRY